MNTLDVYIWCRVTRQLVLLLELLNKVWDLANWFCLQGVRVVRIKSGDRFGFSGETVLLGSSGDQVSFNTTVGGS